MIQRQLFESVLIETKNVCTRKCWFCKFGQERQDSEVVEMDWNTIERIVYNLRDLDFAGRISWFWINEPLLDKRILEILRLTREHCPRAFLSLLSNGDLLTDKVYKDLIESGLDGLRVSIYDDKTLAKFALMPKDDRLLTYDMRNTDGKIENRASNIKQHEKYFEHDRQERLNRSCARPFDQLVIDTQGQVVLCCSDMYSDVVMGDTKTHRLEEIWNNKHFEHYRKTLNESGRSGLKLCDGCSFSGDPSQLYHTFKDRYNEAV